MSAKGASARPGGRHRAEDHRYGTQGALKPVEVMMPDGQVMAVLWPASETPPDGTGGHTFTREKVGTRYIFTLVRTLVDPADRRDIETAGVKVSQNSPGRFEVPNWDQASRKKVHDALLVLGETVPDTRRIFGTKDQVEPVRHLIGTAWGWGGNPEKDAFYLNLTPGENDGTTIHKLKRHRRAR
jgi:hypothetical protein